MNNKVLIICGATATGKTNLALSIAKELNGELIAADARQIYKYLDIGTGKDKEKIKKSGIKIHLYDEIDPKYEFSISEYQKKAFEKIEHVLDKNKLPIVVGGNGFYISSLVSNIQTINIPKNQKLRDKLEKKSKEELFKILLNLNFQKATNLNNSDKNNKRRLIRAIEIEKSNKKNVQNKKNDYDFLIIGLEMSKKSLEEKIKKRVLERIKKGSQKEVINLLNKKHLNFSMQSMQTFGYKEWQDFFSNKISLDKVVENWQKNELKYAKRQKTWFKKQKNIHWFDIEKKDLNIDKLIKNWYY